MPFTYTRRSRSCCLTLVLGLRSLRWCRKPVRIWQQQHSPHNLQPPPSSQHLFDAWIGALSIAYYVFISKQLYISSTLAAFLKFMEDTQKFSALHQILFERAYFF